MILAFDLETHLFGPGNMAPKPVCLSADSKSKEGPVLMEAGRIELFMRKALESKALIIGHNVAYDFTVLHEHCPDLAPLIWQAYENDRITDTMLRERLLDIAEGKLGGWTNAGGFFMPRKYGLNDLSQRYLNKKLDKSIDSWRFRYSELDGIPIDQWPESARVYPIDDATAPRAIYDLQEKRAERMGYTIPTQFEDTRAAFALQLTSTWGIRTDGDRVQKLWDATDIRLKELQEILVNEGLMRGGKQIDMFGMRPKASKNLKAVKARIEAAWPKEFGEIPRTPKGALKTGKEVIDLCGDPVLDFLVEFNALEKSGSTYIRKLFEGIHWPIHARFNAIGAETDRTSSSNPNMQNQPRMPGVRECFISRKGRVFIACDFDAQEMRTFAQCCYDIVGRSKLGDRFNANPQFDPHQEFADSWGGPRQDAKIANFGLMGGMGVKGLVRYAKGYGQTWTPAYAGEIISNYKAQWTEVEDYFAHISMLVGRAGVGNQTHPRSGFRRGLVTYCNAANGYFQTLAAHASKAAAFQVAKRCYNDRRSWLYGSRPCVFVHDEDIVEAFEGYEHEVGLEIAEVMEEAMAKWTPDVPTSASATAMKRWSKKAKAVHDKHGRLIPWKEAA